MNRLLFTLCMLFSLQGLSQETPINVDANQIDTLFKKYDASNAPGYALGIIQNGQLVFSRGYGSANLDYNIPITDSTAFYIGSMAKQFTAAALLILEAQGKLDFKAEVKTYLEDFPSYAYPITIEHLVHHISGIRETNSMQLFQGTDLKFEEVFNTDDLYNLVIAQKELNFEPGTEYRYSSGGYAVLAKVVEQLSGLSFRDFLKQYIFEPLGMQYTIVSDNHNEVIKNRAVSYWPISDTAWERRNLVFDAYGDGGIITTVKDLVQWDKAFYQDLLGVKDFAEKMYQKGRLNSGRQIEYARALQIRNYKGQRMITHNGGMLGFRVDMVRFPDQKTSIILLGNSAYMNPTGDALKLADIVLKDYFSTPNVNSSMTPDMVAKPIPSALVAQKAGYYWTDQMNYFRRLSFQNDSLFMDSGNAAYKQYLLPLSENEYYLEGQGDPLKLVFTPDESVYKLTISFGPIIRKFRLFDPEPPQSLKEIQSYIGTYTSDELDCNYQIFKEADILYLQIGKQAPKQIFPLPPNTRMVWNGKRMLWIGFGEIKFDIDLSGKVLGFTIGDQRVSGIYFKREIAQ